MPALFIAALWLAIVIAGGRAWLMSSHRFNILSLEHWSYLAKALGRWWNGGGPFLQMQFVLQIAIVLLLAVVGTALVYRRARKANLSVPNFAFARKGAGGEADAGRKISLRPIWRIVRWILLLPFRIFAWIGLLGLRVTGQKPVDIAGADLSWRNDPVDHRVRVGKFTLSISESVNASSLAAPVAPAHASSAPAPEARSVAALVRSAPSTSETGQPDATRASPQEQVRVGFVTGPDPDEAEATVSPAASEAAPVPSKTMTDADVRNVIIMWLRDHGRTAHFYVDMSVNGDYGDFANDSFDDKADATIPLVVIGQFEIMLVWPVSLTKQEWKAAVWDPDRQGVPDWTSSDGIVSPCHLSLAKRGWYRFVCAHGAIMLEAAGMTPAAVIPAVVFADGDIANLQEIEAGWDDAGVAIGHLDVANCLERLLSVGEEDEGPNPTLVRAIVNQSADISRRKRV